MVSAENIFLAGLAALLLLAAIGDWRSRIIPNWLNFLIAVSAVAFWMAIGLTPWPGMVLQLGVAALVFALFALCFALGMMGGGDVKLIGALALWLPWPDLVRMLLIMAVAGGILTFGMLLTYRLRGTRGSPEVPYGIAIAFGGLWVISERYLNHLA